MSGQKLTQGTQLIQKLTASQKTVQLMKMIEMPYLTLEQDILREVTENPALEIDNEDDAVDTMSNSDDFLHESNDRDDNDLEPEINDSNELFEEEYFHNDEYDLENDKDLDYKTANINHSPDDLHREKMVVYNSSFHEYLLTQLSEMDTTDRERELADYIIGNLDESGYLLRENKSIANDLLFGFNIKTTPEEIENVIVNFVQELDPAGIGARNLQECLLIQLYRINKDKQAIPNQIIANHYEAFVKRHYDKIQKQMNLSDKSLKEALEIIKKMNPRPAYSQSQSDIGATYINPDFTIVNNGEKLELSLNNQYIPKLRVNKDFGDEYRFLSKEKIATKRIEAQKFIKENVDSANAYIKLLSLREMTLFNTMYAIMEIQKNYFLSGNDADLKPMILKDIAQKVQLDESTISRVSNSKYVQTIFGTIPLKHLFSESIGDVDTSSKVVKQHLLDIIENENKQKPYTDDQLCDMLNDKGFAIARRTVAKYREQIGMPVARLRKEL